MRRRALERPDVLRQFLVTAPEAGGVDIAFSLVGVVIPTRLAYVALVFVHPNEVSFAEGNSDFRDRYFVDHFGLWANGHGMGVGDTPETSEFEIVIDRSIYPDLMVAAGTQLSVTVAIHVMASSDADVRNALLSDMGNRSTDVLTIINSETTIAGVLDVAR